MIAQKHKIQECWIWPKNVTEFVKSRIVGHSLNVCSGKNPLCDVNIDLDPENPKQILGEFSNLPFPSGTFDTVISDPPWKIGYYQRMKPFFEVVRVCKVGGTIIYNATWQPESVDTEIIEQYMRKDDPWGNCSYLTVYKKLRSNPRYQGKAERELLKNGVSLNQKRL